jgi:hypothetical protein
LVPFRWSCASALALAWCLGVPSGAASAQASAGPSRTVIVLDASLSMVVREGTATADGTVTDLAGGER